MVKPCNDCKHFDKGYNEKPCCVCVHAHRENKFEPEEPKVLTADRWFDKQTAVKSFPDEETKHLILCWTGVAFNDGHKNGRLERDLELRPFVDFCNQNADRMCTVWSEAREFLRNIKPLNHDG